MPETEPPEPPQPSFRPDLPTIPPGRAPEPPPAAAPGASSWLASHRREAAWILAGVAFLVRLVYLFLISKTPYYHPDRLDPLFYFNWGRSIAAGHWIGDRIFVQSPLYAYLIAVFLKIFGERFIFPTLQIFQILIGVGTVLLTVRIGRKVLGDETAAWTGGVLAALYGSFLFYDGMVMKTFLSTFLTVYLLDLLLRSEGTRRGLLIFSGFIFAMTSLVRDNFVLLYPLLLAGLYFAFREIGRRERLRACLLFTAGAALGILPVTIRNYAVGREFALLTTGGGEVFYIGNNADANGRYLPPPFVHATPEKEHDDFIAKASELAGRKLTPGESSGYWLGQGLSWIRENPAGWVRLLLRKTVIFWNYYELPDNYNYYEVREVLLYPASLPGILLFVPLMIVAFGLVAPLGLTGIALTAQRWRRLLLVYLILFGYMGTVLLFFNFSRFRVPIVPFLCLFAGATLAAFGREARAWFRWFWAPKGSAAGADAPPPWQRYLKRPWVLAYPLLFLVLAWMVSSVGTGGRGVFPALQTERNLGDTYRLEGRFEEAEREYHRGLQILGDEPMDPATAATLGVDPARVRQEVESERMAQGVNFSTVKAALHFGLGAVWLDQGKALLSTDRGKAEDLFRRALAELETANKTLPAPPFIRRLAEVYTLLDKKVEAEKAYRAGQQLAPDDFSMRYDLAGLFYDEGRFEEALKEMEAAKKVKPRLTVDEEADYHFGVALVLLDGYRARGRALFHFQRALALKPDHREAKRIRELISGLEKSGVKPEPE